MKQASLHPSREVIAARIVYNAMILCGLLSSLLYIVMNVLCVMRYEGYHIASQTVSELSAINAPTRKLWELMAAIYSLLSLAFGWGVWIAGIKNRMLSIVGGLLFVNAAIGFFWPPMQQREVLVAEGATLTDTYHIVFTIITVSLMMVTVAFGAAAFGKPFRRYSIITLLILVIFGALAGLAAPRIALNLPTPYVGIWERISIGAYLTWVAVLSIKLLRKGE